jgi:hypothetical protein
VKQQRAPRVRRDRVASPKPPSGRGSGGGRKALSATNVYGVPVPEKLHEAIETERDNLSKVESILACMVIAMEYDAEPLTGPYFPTVAQTAREILARSINSLDSVILKQKLLNKIEDEFYRPFIEGLAAPSLIYSDPRVSIGQMSQRA